MKKKLFTWWYKHNFNVCALAEDGKLLMAAHPGQPTVEACENLSKLLFSDNQAINAEYEVIPIDQASLDKHMYEGGDRDLLRKDFQAAWDIYKGVLSSAN